MSRRFAELDIRKGLTRLGIVVWTVVISILGARQWQQSGRDAASAVRPPDQGEAEMGGYAQLLGISVDSLGRMSESSEPPSVMTDSTMADEPDDQAAALRFHAAIMKAREMPGIRAERRRAETAYRMARLGRWALVTVPVSLVGSAVVLVAAFWVARGFGWSGTPRP